jgi:hypothetical protein
MSNFSDIIGFLPLLLHDYHGSVYSFLSLAPNFWEHLFNKLAQGGLSLLWIDRGRDRGNRSKKLNPLIFPPGRDGQTLLKCVVFDPDTLD